MRLDRSRQRGFTMVVGLILLILMTLVAISAFNLGKGSLQVVDNGQQRSTAQVGSQVALDQIISSTAFSTTPSTVFSNKDCPSGITVGTNGNGICVDANGDGKTIVRVALSPQPGCVSTSPVALAQLNLAVAEDQNCVASQISENGKLVSSSLCSDTLWDVNALATEPTSETPVLVTEGVAVRSKTDDAATFCP